jgi:predicted dehydrogenase
MRVGLVGCGRIGERHAEAYRQLGAELVVADADATAAKELAARAGVQAVRIEALFDAKLDALDICVPSYFHRDWILTGLEHGLDVFCEKPLCLSSADAQAILDAATAARRSVVVGYLYRHHPAFTFMKEVLAEQVIGEPHLALTRLGGRGSHQAWKHDEQGGGVVFEMMVHMLDLLSWLLGPLADGSMLHRELILPVREIGGLACQAAAPDCAVASFRAGGVRAFCQSDLLTPSFMNYVEVHGSNGTVTGSILSSMPATVYCIEPRGLFDRGHNARPAEPVNLFVRELGDFLAAVESGEPDLAALRSSVELARFIDTLQGE